MESKENRKNKTPKSLHKMISKSLMELKVQCSTKEMHSSFQKLGSRSNVHKRIAWRETVAPGKKKSRKSLLRKRLFVFCSFHFISPLFFNFFKTTIIFNLDDF
jgi:hypothetical protein